MQGQVIRFPARIMSAKAARAGEVFIAALVVLVFLQLPGRPDTKVAPGAEGRVLIFLATVGLVEGEALIVT